MSMSQTASVGGGERCITTTHLRTIGSLHLIKQSICANKHYGKGDQERQHINVAWVFLPVTSTVSMYPKPRLLYRLKIDF